MANNKGDEQLVRFDFGYIGHDADIETAFTASTSSLKAYDCSALTGKKGIFLSNPTLEDVTLELYVSMDPSLTSTVVKLFADSEQYYNILAAVTVGAGADYWWQSTDSFPWLLVRGKIATTPSDIYLYFYGN